MLSHGKGKIVINGRRNSQPLTKVACFSAVPFNCTSNKKNYQCRDIVCGSVIISTKDYEKLK